MNPAVKDMAISAIKADPRLQMRVALNEEHVDDIKEALTEGKELDGPLPVVFMCGLIYWLVDGFHRLAAHIKAGLKNMRCEVRRGDFRDALRYALGANQHTCLKRTNADKRKAVETALANAEIALMSNRQIADLCGVSMTMVNNIRNAATGNGLDLDNRKIDAEKTENGFHLDNRKFDAEKTENGFHLENRATDTDTADKRNCAPDPEDVLKADAQPSEDTPALEEAKEQNLTDPFGHPLTDSFVGVFQHRAAILSMVAELGDDKDRIKKLRSHASGEFIQAPVIEYHLDIAQQLLKAAVPQAICPDCGAARPKQAICRTCDGAGYVGEGKFAQLAPVLQQKAKAFETVERGETSR